MILPQTYPVVLALMILSFVCLGSWAGMFKLAGRWRFELFYFDFALGLIVAAVVYAFTVGMMRSSLPPATNTGCVISRSRG